MRCPACSTENPPRAKFCFECAAPLARSCLRCGTPLPDGAKFCTECAQPVQDATLSSRSAPHRAFTPRHRADEILASRAALVGERKQVTVLFADVVGSTELIRDCDPEEAQALLDGAMQRMMDAVHRYEGTVSRLTGDGLMALFGAPLAHEDHAARACYAAMAMQEAIRAYAEEARRRHGAPVEARVGLSSGEVVVRTISDDLHMDYTAMGQTVHLAARMEQLARAGTTVLTASTLGLVEGYVRVRPLGPVPVKGLDEPVEVYELLGAGLARTRFQAGATRGLTRFVGREAELAALHAALERAAQGHGQLAALVGEPGVGKSRLTWELTHSHRTRGWLVLESGSVSYGKATSYLPVIDLLKSYCHVEDRDDPRTVREKLAGKLLMLDRALEPALPALLALLDVPVEEAAWNALDPAQRRRATLDAVKRVLLRESREQPLLLVFEDLHWIDSETQAVLDGLVESLPTARVLLLVNYRPEYAHAWGSRTYYTQVRVDPLGGESAEALLDGLLGDDAGLERLKALLIARTEGNPFFLEECVRSLVETRALVGERGAYRLPRALAGVHVPATVQAVLAARIDRLPPEEKRLLQTAAVVGKDVPDALLRAVADHSDDDLRRGRAGLQAAEFLYEASLFPEPEYTFKHALTHEVAYGGVLQERRRALHRRIVEAIEARYPDRLAEQVEQLAEHAFRGEDLERAVAYGRQAGQKAAARAAHEEAAAAFERAIEALERLPVSPERQAENVELRLMIRTPLWQLAEFERVRDHLRRAEDLADAIDDHGRLGRVLALLIQTLGTLGQPEQSSTLARRARELADASGDHTAQVLAYVMSGWLDQTHGAYRSAVEHARYVTALLGNPGGDGRFGLAAPMTVNAASVLVRALTELGEFEEALTAAEAAVETAEDDARPFAVSMANTSFGYAHLVRGELTPSLASLSRAVEVAAVGGLLEQQKLAAATRARALILAGRPDDALMSLAAVEGSIGARGGRRNTSLVLLWRAEALARTGRRREAADALDDATTMARACGERGNEAYALWVSAQVAEEDPASRPTAEALYRDALALAEELGMRPLQAHCHLGLGKLLRCVGRIEEARAELNVAVAMLREMGMASWLPEAEAELAQATDRLPA